MNHTPSSRDAFVEASKGTGGTTPTPSRACSARLSATPHDVVAKHVPVATSGVISTAVAGRAADRWTLAEDQDADDARKHGRLTSCPGVPEHEPPARKSAEPGIRGWSSRYTSHAGRDVPVAGPSSGASSTTAQSRAAAGSLSGRRPRGGRSPGWVVCHDDRVRITLVGVDTPVLTGVTIGVQRGREVVDEHAANGAALTWRLEARRAGDDDVRGAYVHGRPGDRFLYLSWQRHGVMFRRAKLMLAAVPAAVLAAAEEAGLHGRVSLVLADGSPLCAAVRPPAVTWSAAEGTSGPSR